MSDDIITFDQTNPNWSPDGAANQLFLRGVKNYMNSLLQARGHVFLNDVFDALRHPRTKYGQMCGWIYSEDSDGIEFVLTELGNKSFQIEFNVQGEILSTLP